MLGGSKWCLESRSSRVSSYSYQTISLQGWALEISIPSISKFLALSYQSTSYPGFQVASPSTITLIVSLWQVQDEIAWALQMVVESSLRSLLTSVRNPWECRMTMSYLVIEPLHTSDRPIYFTKKRPKRSSFVVWSLQRCGIFLVLRLLWDSYIMGSNHVGDLLPLNGEIKDGHNSTVPGL